MEGEKRDFGDPASFLPPEESADDLLAAAIPTTPESEAYARELIGEPLENESEQPDDSIRRESHPFGEAAPEEENLEPMLARGLEAPGVAEEAPDEKGPGGETASSDKPYWRTNIFKRLVFDQGYFVVHWVPYEASRPQFAIPFLVATFSAAMSPHGGVFGYDLTLERSIEQGTTGGADTTARFFSELGNAVGPCLAIGAAYVLARHAGNDRLAEASSLSFEALVDAGIWSEILKHVAARTRPSGGSEGKFFQYSPPPGQELGSFPSGHATGAFAFATVFAHVYPDKPWVSWLAYGTATMIGISRVALGRHFPADVVAGAMLGNSMGRMVMTRQEESTAKKTAVAQLTPIYDPQHRRYGLAFEKRW